MQLSEIIEAIQKLRGYDYTFRQATEEDLQALRNLNLPESIVAFYSQYEPVNVEINFIRVHSIKMRVGHKSEHIKDWFNRTQRTSIDEIKQDNEIPRI